MAGAAESKVRACVVCGCTDDRACFQHSDRGVNGCWAYDDDKVCAACEKTIAADPVFRQLLAMRMHGERIAWPGRVAHFARMTGFDRHDTLFCVVHSAGEDKLDREAYRVRLLQVASVCLDMIEAIDQELKERAS